MIRLSNLRLERGVPFKYGKAQARIICDMEANFTDVKEFYFCVDDEYADWLASDVYDAFLVAMLYPAMCYGEEIEIDGPVSKRIYHNIIRAYKGKGICRCQEDGHPPCRYRVQWRCRFVLHAG